MQQQRHSSPENLTLDLSKSSKKGGRGSQELSPVRMDRPDSPRKGRQQCLHLCCDINSGSDLEAIL